MLPEHPPSHRPVQGPATARIPVPSSDPRFPPCRLPAPPTFRPTSAPRAGVTPRSRPSDVVSR